MLFNSLEFIFFFLPASLLFYYACVVFVPVKEARYAVLAIFSLFFYGWWNWRYLLLIVLSIVFNYVLGTMLSNSRHNARKKNLLIIGVGLNLLLLGYYKYTNFFLDTLAYVSGASHVFQNIILPLAISFFTFQQIAYLVDSYRSETKEYNFIHYVLFVTFFPQLIAGPIVHHKEMMPQFQNNDPRLDAFKNIYKGLCIFTLGLFKKLVIADGISPYANKAFTAADGGTTMYFLDAWGGAFAYTIQLYFDFSGYADMAIGAALMFGIMLPINFNSPYKSLNIIEFWRRWHMTLSRFLRDYVYIPLGGNRNGVAQKHINLMITMLLGGLWHGAGWNFVIWGGLHGLYLVINHLWQMLTGKAVAAAPASLRRLYALFSWGVTLLAVVVAWVFFRAETFNGAVMMLKAMAGVNGIEVPYTWAVLMENLPVAQSVITLSPYDYFPNFGQVQGLFYIALCLLVAAAASNSQQIMEKPRRSKALYSVYMAMVFAFCIVFINRGSQFLYFQF